jgi:cation diffusion facilitator CzcD-associated flavoprotein CzcO
MTHRDLDVLIIGAGLSGVGGAARLVQEHPDKTYAVLEAREESGGTWSLFRYPGVRSDSDMFTLGYRFRPWTDTRTLADAPSILAYIRDTAREYGVDRHIHYGQEVVSADWDSSTARWTVTTKSGEVWTAGFLWACSGYYDIEQGYLPEFPGIEDFAGRVVHPQHWPDDLDYAGANVVVIGSGATAVTLVPAMAESGAAHVTMLQRSPSYVLSVPRVDPISAFFQRRLPRKLAYMLSRWQHAGIALGFYQFARRFPGAARRAIRKGTVAALPEGYPVNQHFNPSYNVWDQRVCFVPDNDLFDAIKDGKADVVTDTIETFTEKGIRLASGEELTPDIVVTATGLNVRVFGGASLSIDGEPVDVSDTMTYRALMIAGLPNFAFTVGYTNASWTLKADLVADYVCRLLAHMDETGARTVVPTPDPTVGKAPFMDFTPGYVLRVLDTLPNQGDREPWRLKQNWFKDVRTIRRARLEDGILQFR